MNSELSQSPREPVSTPVYTPQTSPPPAVGSQPSNLSPAAHEPYTFILDAQAPPKRSAFASMSTLKRVLVIGGAVALGIVLVLTVLSLFAPKDDAVTLLTTLVQEQQEIVRVADLGSQSANGASVRNLATNVSLSVGSDQTQMMQYLSSIKKPVNKKKLAIKYDAKTDQTLQSARQTNTFDHATVQSLQMLLVEYRANLNSTYQGVKGPKAREQLKNSYQAADLLIAQANKVANQ